MRDLIPTTEERNGMQRFIYRSIFPITFYVASSARYLDIICTIDYLRQEETVALLRVFGFADGLEIVVERSGPHITFSQKLLCVEVALDANALSMIKCKHTLTSLSTTEGTYGIAEGAGASETGDPDMCCRYFIDDKVDEFAEYFEQAASSPLAAKMVAKLGRPLRTSGEISPSDMVPVIARDKRGTVRAFPMVWGFAPQANGKFGLKSSAPLFNARVETASEKPSFSEAWTSHRCVIPASYFFEWGPPPVDPDGPVQLTRAGKARYIIQPKGASVTWMAGLYRMEQDGDLTYPTFTVLTRDSTGDMKTVHDRMPVMLPATLIDTWTDPNKNPSWISKSAITRLMVEAG